MIRTLILAAALPALAGCDPERLGGKPVAPMPTEKAPPTAPVAPDPYYPGAAPLTEEALERILRQHLIPLNAKVDALNVDVQALAFKVGNLERATADEQKLVRDKLAEHQKLIDELRAAVKNLPARAGVPKAAPQAPSLEELQSKVNALTKQVEKQRKQLDKVRANQQAPAAPPVTKAPELPRLLTAASTFGTNGREWRLVALRAPCGGELAASLPVQRPNAESVWAPLECPHCRSKFSARVVSLAPLSVEVLPK